MTNPHLPSKHSPKKMFLENNRIFFYINYSMAKIADAWLEVFAGPLIVYVSKLKGQQNILRERRSFGTDKSNVLCYLAVLDVFSNSLEASYPMILSHKYKFIFLKTNKTAGTSVEIALSRVCGKSDIITPISKKDEILRKEWDGLGPQNYINPGRPRFYNHMSAEEVIELVGENVWNEYYKFCIERNPWDRVISLYFFNHKSEPRPSISDFIRSGELQILKEKGLGLYTIDGEVCVDHIIDFANLDDELNEIRRRLGIEEVLSLPRAKGQFRKDKRHYSEFFDAEDEEEIAKLFEKEISIMGYSVS